MNISYKIPLNSTMFVVKNNEIHKLVINRVILTTDVEPVYNDWILESSIFKTEAYARKAILNRMQKNIKVINHI